jgi:hypothetical protein
MLVTHFGIAVKHFDLQIPARKRLSDRKGGPHIEPQSLFLLLRVLGFRNPKR